MAKKKGSSDGTSVRAEEARQTRSPTTPATSEDRVDKNRGSTFPVVGIGASAGGLKSFETFFTHMPPDSGMAFILIQHLDPNRESMLVELLQRYTQMEVVQVQDGRMVEPNHVYIIPPNRDMALMQGTLYLMEPVAPRGLRLPIDTFFRSLARDQGERAICVILSGTGTDGTLGLKAIKEEGGMAMVQEPASSSYDGMPQSAINTGLVDYVLPPEAMPEQLINYTLHTFVPGAGRLDLQPQESAAMQKIFLLLRNQTGHDFSQYKPNTTTRRIQRRMTVNQIKHIDHYVRHLQRNPLEVETLFKELLIGVTAFFRDPEAYTALENKIIPKIFEDRSEDRPIRVWVTGCSTGEEAYSIAILLYERIEKLQRPYKVQIFATDVDAEAIERGRQALYPDNIAADVSPERLQKFFERESSGYRVKKVIREMVILAVQNVIQDPPFSRLDLISCRNLLIYLDTELQKKVIPRFHYALRPGGFMFLGTAESLGEIDRLFKAVDRKWKLFQRLEVAANLQTVLDFPTLTTSDEGKLIDHGPHEKKISVRDLLEKLLLSEYTPVCVVVTEQGQILYIHGETGKYLQLASGEAELNILRMAREGLRMPLTTALRKAANQKKDIIHEDVPVKASDKTELVRLTVRPLLKPAAMQGLIIVMIEEIVPVPQVDIQARLEDAGQETTRRAVELEQELNSTRQFLQTTIEELETSNEELKATNEELQSSNEELQSTNEELVTAKEELQSVNEELMTVNVELENKVEELTLSNSDMNNLLTSIDVGVIFLDRRLNIRRFNQAATVMFNLIETDIGRPLGHTTSNLEYENLLQDAQNVLESLIPRKIEVYARDEHWYWLRIRPYRTQQDTIAGLVLTCSDITLQKDRETDLSKSQAFLQSIYMGTSLGIYVIDVGEDGDFRYASTNPTHKKLTGFSEEAVRGKRPEEVGLPPEIAARARANYQRCVETKQAVEYEIETPGADHRHEWWQVILHPQVDDNGRVYRIIGTAASITTQKQAELALREREAQMQTILKRAKLAIFNQDQQLRYVFVLNPHPIFADTEIIGKSDADLFSPEEAARLTRVKREVLGSGVSATTEVSVNLAGEQMVYRLVVEPWFNNGGSAVGVTCVSMDITEQKRIQEELVRLKS